MPTVACVTTAGGADGPMETIPKKRDIIDRARLSDDLAAIFAAAGDATRCRGSVLERLKAAMEHGRAEIRRRFDGGRSAGAAAVRAQTFLFDQLIRALYDLAAEQIYPAYNPTAAEHLAVVAVGGYGRGELAPHSDIDLLFLFPYKQTARGEQVVEYMLYMLWDMRLKVGHATRSIDDCVRLARQDITIRTSLLEARYVWGDQSLYGDLRTRFQEQVVATTALAFVEAKLAERDERHRRHGDSRYVIEPNVKENKGGLRDLQTLYWIAKYVYHVESPAALVDRGVLSQAEARNFDKLQVFLWTVRCHLHYITGRAEERLTVDLQPEIARAMGYTDHAGARGVERFMKHYYLVAKGVGDLTRIFCAAIESEHKRRPLMRRLRPGRRKEVRGFQLEDGRLAVADAAMFTRDPAAMVRLFHVSQAEKLEIHPGTLRLVTRNLHRITAGEREDPEANRLFIEILTAKSGIEKTLRQMNEAGVFGRFLPDFGRVVGQTQHDMYHVYTVDEHTIFALGILNRIDQGELAEDHPLSTEVIREVQSRRALYIGLLFHDIGKGRGGNHSEIGAAAAEQTGPRLGLDPEETETVAWLVRHHLAMSNTAFKRDLSDPKTIKDFAELVQSPERLRLLLCLTVADIRAVGPTVWNNWKAALLRELYYATEELMSGGHRATDRDGRVGAAHAALREALASWPEADLEAHIGRGYPAYWLAFDTPTLVRHARQIRQAERESRPLSVETRVDRRRAVTEVTIYTQDHPGLFSRLAGGFAAAGASVVDARIFTTPQGMALDTFWIQDADGGAFDQPSRLAKMSVMIERSLAGRLKLEQAIRERGFRPARQSQAFIVQPRVVIDNKASATHTVIEVNGADRPGFLYTVTRALSELSLQISSAKISTYGERAVSLFYVKDGFGMKVAHETALKRIRERLRSAIGDADEAGIPLPRGQAGDGTTQPAAAE